MNIPSRISSRETLFWMLPAMLALTATAAAGATEVSTNVAVNSGTYSQSAQTLPSGTARAHVEYGTSTTTFGIADGYGMVGNVGGTSSAGETAIGYVSSDRFLHVFEFAEWKDSAHFTDAAGHALANARVSVALIFSGTASFGASDSYVFESYFSQLGTTGLLDHIITPPLNHQPQVILLTGATDAAGRFDVDVSLDNVLYDNPTPVATNKSFAEYSLKWGGITGVADSTGAEVQGWNVTSDSGFNYRYAFGATSAVPEPAKSWMLFGGVLLLAGLQRYAPIRRRTTCMSKSAV